MRQAAARECAGFFTTQFTCLTRAKVQILTPEALRGRINNERLMCTPFVPALRPGDELTLKLVNRYQLKHFRFHSDKLSRR